MLLADQQGPPNGTNSSQNATRPASGLPTATNATNATNVSGGGGGFGIGIPDPVDLLSEMVGALADGLIGLGEGLISIFNGFVFNLPAPGEPDAPDTWATPNDGTWSGVQGAMGFTTALAIAVWAFAGGRAFLESDERTRRAAFLRCGYSGVMILLGIAITGLTLHLANGIIQGLAPDAEAFFQTPEDASKLVVGGIVAFILGIVQTATVIGALVVLALERMLVYLTVYLWPLAWACRAHDGFVKSLGETVTYLFGAVVALKLVQALIVRLLFELPLWGEGAGTTLVSMLMTVAGLAFAFIIFPKNMIDHANDAASVSLGMGAATSRAGEYGERSVNRVYDRVNGTYQSYRGSGEGTAAQGPTVGHVGSREPTNTGRNTAGPPTPPPTHRVYVSDSPSDDTDDGLDANEWERHRERIDFERDRGFQ
ncbi:hypothetical protein [Halomarina oriensis]|uniref:Uncharacterized protein n=1 Tax=Halomarina oriensis TaxID=671145 RepID=A0A6B0GXV7_9EURY|nr:hypothetical protein [Halomarina oriensis]MWG36618.1 hypothetical protein [Halomarina oriensis]